MNLSKKIREAIAYAAEKNGAKVRKDGLPGSTHALIVATIVSEYAPGEENAIIAAILHDIFPHLKTFEHVEVLKKFGPQVNDWLVQLSDKFTGSPSEDLNGISWKAQKRIRLQCGYVRLLTNGYSSFTLLIRFRMSCLRLI